jgi:mercuric ion binding protein
MKTLLITIALLSVAGTTWGQKTPKTQTIVIHTSAECEQCEERLENGLNFTKGVSFAELNLETQDITVKYSTKKMTPEKLRSIINELGYDADETKAKPEAQENLPSCCKPGGMEK